MTPRPTTGRSRYGGAARERGGALVLAVFLVFFAAALGGILIGLPYMSYRKQLSLEEKEMATQAADAAVRDAIAQFESGTLSFTAAAAVYSAASPCPFGKDGTAGYYFTVTPIDSKVARVDGFGQRRAVESRGAIVTAAVETLVRSNTPTFDPSRGGAIMVTSTSAIKSHMQFSSGGVVSGNDVDGTVTVGAVTFSRTPASASLRLGGSGGTSGTSTVNGYLNGVANRPLPGHDVSSGLSVVDELIAALDGIATSPIIQQDAADGQFNTPNTTYTAPYYLVNDSLSLDCVYGSPTSPTIVKIVPNNRNAANTFGALEFKNGMVHGVIYIDLSNVSTTTAQRLTKPILKTSATANLDGIVIIKGPPGALHVATQPLIDAGSNGEFGGAVGIKLRNTATGTYQPAGVPTADYIFLMSSSSNGGYRFDSSNFAKAAAAVAALAPAQGYGIVSYRVVR